MPLEIIILGNQSAFPGPGKHTSGYLIKTNEANFLVDIGSGIVGQFQKYISLQELDALFLTHLHFDHITDFHILIHGIDLHVSLGKFNMRLPVYVPPGEKRRLIEFCEVYNTAKYLIHIDIIEAERDFSFKTIKVKTLLVPHYVPSVSYRFEHNGKTIVFTGDTAFTEELITFSKNADVLVAEATLLKEDEPSGLLHLSARQAAIIAREARVKKLILTHLWYLYPPSKVLKEAQTEFNGEIVLGEEGTIISV